MAEYLNKNLKYLRSVKKISQQDLADKIGIDRSTVSRIENNEIETTVDNAIKIADIFNVSLSDLLNKDLSSNEQSNSELDNILFSKTKELSDEDKQVILNVINAIKKDIDKQLDSE